MGISKKNRRKIIRQGKVFYWYVNPDYDDAGKIKVHILSEDKKFIVAYEIGQVSRMGKSPYLVVIGQEFNGYSLQRTGYIRAWTPAWDDFPATPLLVGKIIDWCYSEKQEIVLVDWKGELISGV
ncbi:hypothetical protein SAMN04487970_105141 [Paenibacillus tianmuensis]|uniref:Uncharacterized protein n=1 Tax=Paenibacillus tianmuensis TaxID=624147 RepID=A0A1G4TIH9_9BACL|nr:hypothetical protein [Paenibacillus tianmuensis]SCW80389.1 hypothetical protein SAMN04487970_105141 [Paenibacillus tianmuensis]